MGLTNLIPLVILLLVVGVGSFIGYSMYQWSNELADRGRKKMESKNMGFTKEGGLRVGVTAMPEENYTDKTQSVLVNVWNKATFPAYKSRLGWNSSQTDKKKKAGSGATSRSEPSQPRPSRQATVAANGASNPAPPQQRGSQVQSGNAVPGGW
ncbi:hypothetical protein LTR08_004681 [Meristemomyces frigidus]|nr:hypothetical protein LTR08_004681 [Meristemomyces frigidus]